MRALVRHVLIWSFAGWWTLLSIFGLGAHLLSEQHECCSALSDCVDSAKHAPTTQVTTCKFGHHHQVPVAASSDGTDGDADSKPHQHDSAHCSICQFFALPQLTAPTFTLPSLVEVTAVSPIPALPFVALERAESWQSRAPPRA